MENLFYRTGKIKANKTQQILVKTKVRKKLKKKKKKKKKIEN